MDADAVQGVERAGEDFRVRADSRPDHGDRAERILDLKPVGAHLLCELPTGVFSRVISLPTEVDSAKAVANIKNGILTLSVPKAEAHRPKAIKVTTVK